MSSQALALHPVTTPGADPDAEPKRLIYWLVAVLGLFIVIALTWAWWAQLDVAVQARGAVVPPSRLQEVSSVDGGIIKEMLVKPGERVKRGQLLARLDTTQAVSDVGESRQIQLGALAGLARVDALLTGQPPVFQQAWREEAPELIEREMQLWRDATREHAASQAALREAVARRRAEVTEAEARISALRQSVRLAEEAFAIEDRLFREGAGARADHVSAKARLTQQRNELDALQQSLPRLAAGLAEARAQLTEADAKLRSVWGAQRTDYQAKASSMGAQLVGKQDKVDRRELLSPMDGVINRIRVATLGGVAQAGQPILEVVPEEAHLVMTVRVKPAEIGFIHAGQKANVRVLAYDAATHGQMKAEVLRVGADALLDEQKNDSYFEVQLSAARDQLKLHGQPLAITPGMPVEVGILTGQRSVLQYLFKPVLRGVQGSLQER